MQQLSSPPIPPAQLRTGCSPSTGFPDKRLASHPLLLVRQSRSRSSTPGRVRNRRGARPIDVLVIRHVDQDHILGFLAMLKDVERPEEVSDIWFNGFDQLNDNEFESFGPVDGEFLSTAIIEQACRGTTRSAGVRSRWPAPDTVRRHGGVHDHRSGSHSAREPDPRWAQECRDNGLIPGVDAQEPVSDDEFESFGAMDVRTVKRLPASRCEPDHSETNMSSIWFLSIRQHEDSLHRLRRGSPSGRVAAAGRHLGDPARRPQPGPWAARQ
jgi:hypothetical protein